MKAKKQDKNLRELFRHKLENAEIIPDASVSSKLMRKLAGREFLRFNPARFNIYYLGGIMVAGLTAAIILSSFSRRSENLPPLKIQDQIPGSESSVKAVLPVKPVQKPDALKDTVYESIENKAVVRPEIHPDSENQQNIDLRGKHAVSPGFVNDSFAEKRLFANPSEDNKKLINSLKADKFLFEVSDTKGCTPLKIQFLNKLADFDSCRWSFGDGGTSDKKNPEWIFDVEGEYKVVLKVFGSDSLLATSSTLITVYPKPSVRFEISPAKAVLPDDEILFQNYSANAIKYFWDFGDGISSELFEPLHRYDKFGNYDVGLIVYSEYGCSDSLVVLNAFSDSEYFIEFPNAFIPNPDGPSGGQYSSKSDESAQVFHPVFAGVSDYQLKIFSKLGILIFETSDINVGWDGYFKGQLNNPGVYVWKVRGKFRNGEPFIKMGDVTLLKN